MSDVALSISVPKLDQILDRLTVIDAKQSTLDAKLVILTAQVQEFTMTVAEDFAALQTIVTDGFASIETAIATERDQLQALFDALRDQITAGLDATQQLADLGSAIPDFGATVQAAAAQVSTDVDQLSETGNAG